MGWRCESCAEDEGEEEDGECEDRDLSAQLRIIRNCDADQNENIAWDWAPGLRRCPWSQVPRSDPAWQAVAIWSDWKQLGLLPFPGSIGEQPPWVYFVIRMAESIAAEMQDLARQAAEQERTRVLRESGRGR